MNKKNLHDILDEIADELKVKKEKLKFYGSNHHDSSEQKGYLFLKNNVQPSFWKDVFEFFLPVEFAMTYHQPIFKLGTDYDGDMVPYRYIQVLDDNPDVAKEAKRVASTYNLKIREYRSN